MNDNALLAKRGAVVVGGTRGIGRAVAELLAQCGAGVVVNGRDAQAVNETVNAITSRGGKAIGVAGAANDSTTATALVENLRL